MAGAGAKLFTSGSVLTADQVNTFLMDQSIMRFASTTARDAAFGGAGEPTLAEGMFAYTTDTNTLWLYNGSSWVAVLGSDIGEISTDNRNVLDNGAMQVAQRGTSANFDSGAKPVTTDRWNVYNDIGAAGTISVENDAPTGSGFRKSMKVLYTAANASPSGAIAGLVFQYIEGQNLQQFAKGTASAKPFAMSFWVKSNLTGTYIVQLRDRNNARSVSASYTISASATWEKKTITFPADTTGAFNNDNGGSLQVNFFQSLGSGYTSGTLQTTWGAYSDATTGAGQVNLAATINNYWQFTGVQLEVGSVATPFEFEDYGTTLEKCQRYFVKWTSEANAFTAWTMGLATGGATANAYFSLPTTMRVFPSTLTYSLLAVAEAALGTISVTSATLGYVSNKTIGLVMSVATAGLTQHRPIQLFSDNSTSAFVAVSAEL